MLAPRLTDLLTALAPLTERADQIRQIAELANGNGANQYRMTLSSFVLAARLEEVAQAASERLLTMTAGRYSLAHSDARRATPRRACPCSRATRGPASTGTPPPSPAARRSWPAWPSRSAWPTW